MTPLRLLIGRKLEEELRGFRLSKAGFENLGGDESGQRAEGVDAEEGEALVEGSGEDEGND